MTRVITGLCFAVAVLFTSTATAQFSDNFDSYATGASMHGVNGWKGWDNDPTWTAFTSSVQALSAPNSLAIGANADLVNELGTPTTGCWEITVDQYIPSAMTGENYFILMNTYEDGGLGEKNWSVQMRFGGVGTTQEGMLADSHDFSDGAGGYQLFTPIVFDQWVQLKFIIDLEANTLQQWYNGEIFRGSVWSGRPGFGPSGVGNMGKSIGSVDLFGNGADDCYYDNFSMQSISCPPVNPLVGVETTRGDYVSGGIPDLEFSDNDDYGMRRKSSDTNSRTETEVTSFSPTQIPTVFEITVEGAVFARSNVVQTIELFDYVADAWEVVDTRNAARSPSPDSSVTVQPTGDLTRFISIFDGQPATLPDTGAIGTREIRARVNYTSDSRRQNFASNTDMVSWNIE